MEKKKNGLWIFLALVFTLSWGFSFGVIYPAVSRGANYTVYAAILMFFPALCAALTRLLTKEGFKDSMFRPRFKGNGKAYVLAWFGPAVLTLLGAALFFLLFPAELDWSAPFVREQMAAAGNPYEVQALPMSYILAMQLASAVALGPAINLITALGEEWGWRAYLFPKLCERMNEKKAALLSGLIWGVWHAPIIALGHNYETGYPTYPWGGILAMCVFCVAFGVLLSALTVHTKSVIPAALCHGGFNAVAGIGAYVTADGGNRFVGPLPTGILGGLPILLLACFVLFRAFSGEKEKSE